MLLLRAKCQITASHYVHCRLEIDSSYVIAHRKWPLWKVVLLCGSLLAVLAGLEVMLVLVIRGPYARGVEWPVETIGIIALVTLLAGYVPIPFELIRRRGRVQGISLVFLAIDWLGAFFSLMSLGDFDTSFFHLNHIQSLTDSMFRAAMG
jgi:hypothetical protein